MKIKFSTKNLKETLLDFFLDFSRDITSLASIPIYFTYTLFFLFLKNNTIAVQLIFGFIAIWAIIYPIRIIYFKPRPTEYPVRNILERLNAASYPSIHAARAGLLSIVLAEAYNQM